MKLWTCRETDYVMNEALDLSWDRLCNKWSFGPVVRQIM